MDAIEGHPIPQDVTGFQFRLIGDMTVKQFAYLGAGLLLGFIAYSLPIFFLFKLLLAGSIAFCGVFLAFFPISGRPADAMIGLFLKALIKPTEFSYKTSPIQTTVTPQQVSTTPLPEEKKETDEKVYFSSGLPQPVAPENRPEEEVSPQEDALAEINLPPIEEPKLQEQQLEQTAINISQELEQAKIEEEKQAGQPGQQEAHEKVLDLETQLQDMTAQKEELEKQLLSLQEKLQEKKTRVFTPTMASVPEETQHVRKIPQQLKKATGVPFVPDVPNLITGVVKDPRGNVLPNILIEVKDKDANPVRAFKTNQLGQFASATPILNGTYTITFEDPKKTQRFDTIEITAEGQVIDPIEVISVDEREELRKSLFTN